MKFWKKTILTYSGKLSAWIYCLSSLVVPLKSQLYLYSWIQLPKRPIITLEWNLCPLCFYWVIFFWKQCSGNPEDAGFQCSRGNRSQSCLVLQHTAEQSVRAMREIQISEVCCNHWCRQCFYGKDLFVIQCPWGCEVSKRCLWYHNFWNLLVLTKWVPWVGCRLCSPGLKISFPSGYSLYVNMGWIGVPNHSRVKKSRYWKLLSSFFFSVFLRSERC